MLAGLACLPAGRLCSPPEQVCSPPGRGRRRRACSSGKRARRFRCGRAGLVMPRRSAVKPMVGHRAATWAGCRANSGRHAHRCRSRPATAGATWRAVAAVRRCRCGARPLALPRHELAALDRGGMHHVIACDVFVSASGLLRRPVFSSLTAGESRVLMPLPDMC